MELRDYQIDCLKAIEDKQDSGISRQMVVLPTGAGKTVIFSELIKDRNLKTLVIAHRIELLEQARDKLEITAPKMSVGIFCGDEKCHDKQVTIASIQAASRPKALEILKNEDYGLLIIDEAHHAAAKTYRTLIDELGFNENSSNKLLVGFTATPKRGDNVRLDNVFQEIIYHYTIRKLVHRGYLIKPHGIHVKIGVDLRSVQQQMGDFKKESLRAIMSTDKARSIVVDTVKKYASKRRSIVFGVDIQHAEDLKDDISAAGFTCEAVHSKIPLDKRRSILKDFAEGNLQFVTNPMILTEGFDCPVADCMINAAPTMNRSLYVQKAGRVLRLSPNKHDALLIDFGITSRKHSLCTAITLMGDEIVYRVVTDSSELQPKEEKVDLNHMEMVSEDKAYNPLSDGFSSDQPYKPLNIELNASAMIEENLLVPKSWKVENRYVSEKQIDLIKKLSKKTETKLPRIEILREMGINHASQTITYLLNKQIEMKNKAQKEPITSKQAYFLESLPSEFKEKLHLENIRGMKKEDAKRAIGSFRRLCSTDSNNTIKSS